MKPKYFDKDPLPYCSEGRCEEFDGKRCRKLGYSPGELCKPTISEKLGAPKRAQIICMNDGTEAVVLGGVPEALQLVEKLRREDWEKRKFNTREFRDFEDYCARCFWHLHEDVPILG